MGIFAWVFWPIWQFIDATVYITDNQRVVHFISTLIMIGYVATRILIYFKYGYDITTVNFLVRLIVLKLTDLTEEMRTWCTCLSGLTKPITASLFAAAMLPEETLIEHLFRTLLSISVASYVNFSYDVVKYVIGSMILVYVVQRTSYSAKLKGDMQKAVLQMIVRAKHDKENRDAKFTLTHSDDVDDKLKASYTRILGAVKNPTAIFYEEATTTLVYDDFKVDVHKTGTTFTSVQSYHLKDVMELGRLYDCDDESAISILYIMQFHRKIIKFCFLYALLCQDFAIAFYLMFHYNTVYVLFSPTAVAWACFIL